MRTPLQSRPRRRHKRRPHGLCRVRLGQRPHTGLPLNPRPRGLQPRRRFRFRQNRLRFFLRHPRPHRLRLRNFVAALPESGRTRALRRLRHHFGRKRLRQQSLRRQFRVVRLRARLRTHTRPRKLRRRTPPKLPHARVHLAAHRPPHILDVLRQIFFLINSNNARLLWI